jgi:hypothetical protein
MEIVDGDFADGDPRSSSGKLPTDGDSKRGTLGMVSATNEDTSGGSSKGSNPSWWWRRRLGIGDWGLGVGLVRELRGQGERPQVLLFSFLSFLTKPVAHYISKYPLAEN